MGSRKHGLPLIYESSVTSPAVIADELRFVVPARGHLYGLVIPLSFVLRPEEAIRVELLATGEIDSGQQMRGVGYHQMFSMSMEGPVFATRYFWPGESQQRSTSVSKLGRDLPTELYLKPKRTFLDEYNHRIIIAYGGLAIFHVITLHPLR